MRRVFAFQVSSELPFSKFFIPNHRLASSQSRSQNEELSQQRQEPPKQDAITVIKGQGKKKTMAELDAELQQKMSGLSGDGGESGVEYEDGKPVAMKRGVKNNMFRYI
ncbi:hypothetical protein M426DRAFT_323079 [Hypoxylon sp. CI-4A]|nr:hypothetical protein M426DRAFT_323079 [Hypoxylon sp. CI-4A]